MAADSNDNNGKLEPVDHLPLVTMPVDPGWCTGVLTPAREARGHQRVVAPHVGMSQAALSNLEQGKYSETSFALRLSVALDIDLPPLARLIWAAMRVQDQISGGRAVVLNSATMLEAVLSQRTVH